MKKDFKKKTVAVFSLIISFSMFLSSIILPGKFYVDADEALTISEFKEEIQNLEEKTQPDSEVIETIDEAYDYVKEFNFDNQDPNTSVVDTNNEELLDLINNPDFEETESEAGAKQDLEDANAKLTDAKEDAETLNTNNNTLEQDATNLDKQVSDLEKEINDNFTFSENTQTTESEINDLIDDAYKNLNNLNENISLEEAKQLLEKAVTDKDLASDELNNLTNFINTTNEKINTLQEEYDTLAGQYNNLLLDVDNIKDELGDALDATTSAKEKLIEAQNRVDTLKGQIETIAQNKEELEAIQNQYYALLLYYHRTYKTVVYDENGKLDLEKSAAKITQQKVDQVAQSPDKKLMKLGREYLKESVIYMLHTEYGVPADAEVIFYGDTDTQEEDNVYYGVNGTKVQEAREGVVFTNAQQQDQVVVDNSDKGISGPYKKDYYGNDVPWNDVRYDAWTTIKDNYGRYNHVEVSFIDENGQRQTKYFNYIFKHSDFNDYTQENKNEELSKGVVFLASIEEKDGQYTVERLDETGFNVDNYGNIVNILNELENIEKYNQAKIDLENAINEVKELEKKISDLKDADVALYQLGELELKLSTAKENLAQAKEKKEVLEEKIKQLDADIEKVDLKKYEKFEQETANNDNEQATIKTVQLISSSERVQTGDENNTMVYILFGLGLICLFGYVVKQRG